MATVYYPGFAACRIDANGARIAVTSATITAYNVTTSSSLSSISSDSNGNVAGGSVTATVGDVIRFGHATYPEKIYFTLTATQAEAYTHPDNRECSFVMENLATNLLAGDVVELYAQDLDNLDVTPWKIGEGYSGTTVEIPFQTNVSKNLRIFPRTIDKKLGRVRQDFNVTTLAEDITVPATGGVTVGGTLTSGTGKRILTTGEAGTAVSESPTLQALESTRRNASGNGFEAFNTKTQAGSVTPLFEHVIDRSPVAAATATTVHRYNVSRGQMQYNGDKIRFAYTVSLAATANDKYIRLKFAGTTIFDSANIDPALGNNRTVRVTGEIVRKNISTARVSAGLSVYGWDNLSTYTEITSLYFPDPDGLYSSGTAYDLICELENSTTATDSTLREAYAEFVSAADAALVTSSLWAYGEARYFKGVGVTQYTDGASITTDWQDLSGNSRHATRTGTPTYETGEVNGTSIVRFPGGSVYFTLPDMSALTSGSIFFVWKITDVTTDAGNRFGTSGNTDHYPYTPDTPDGIYSDFGSTTRKTCGGSIVTITGYHTTYIWSKSNDWGLHQNGMKVYETTTNTVGFSSSPRIGHNGSAGMKMDLAAWYVFSNKPTDANVAKMYRYIQKEFGT